MSLSIFAVKNAYHKNGTSPLIKVSGGLPKCLTESLVNKDMMP